VKQKAKIPAGEKVGIQLYPGKRSILDMVLRKPQEDMVEVKMRQVMGRVPFHAWMNGGYLRVVPFALEMK
jgi:hypothetical protein